MQTFVALIFVKYMKIVRSDSWSVQFNMQNETKFSEFGLGEPSALLKFVHCGSIFFYGEIVWSTVYGGFSKT